MMAMRFVAHPITVADIDEVERRFGVLLPQALREFYLQSNGGRPDRNCYEVNAEIYIINTFLPIKFAAGTRGTLERSIQWLKIERQILPENFVPFAVDPFGNYFCFSTGEVDAGVIYFVGMDCKGEPKGVFLCSSFDKFFAELQSEIV